jgi:hypothetical protein
MSEIEIMLMERDKDERAFAQSKGKKTSRKVRFNEVEDSAEEVTIVCDADKSSVGESQNLTKTSKQPEKLLSTFGKSIEISKLVALYRDASRGRVETKRVYMTKRTWSVIKKNENWKDSLGHVGFFLKKQRDNSRAYTKFLSAQI